MLSQKYRRRFNAAAVIAVFCVCAGVILYAKNKLEETVSVSAVPHNDTVIVLDAGQDRRVLSVVI
ncbi:MAG: hypothetical protein MRZ61_00470 [Oscillospiraceae bacterium]|nr:hypothetical protein [Oscillospiraceae bacterium]